MNNGRPRPSAAHTERRGYRPWTPEEDAEARRLRASGLNWRAVGKRIGRQGEGVRERLIRVLREMDPLSQLASGAAPTAQFPRVADRTGVDRNRYPVMPPLHETSWGAITRHVPSVHGAPPRPPSGTAP